MKTLEIETKTKSFFFVRTRLFPWLMDLRRTSNNLGWLDSVGFATLPFNNNNWRKSTQYRRIINVEAYFTYCFHFFLFPPFRSLSLVTFFQESNTKIFFYQRKNNVIWSRKRSFLYLTIRISKAVLWKRQILFVLSFSFISRFSLRF